MKMWIWGTFLLMFTACQALGQTSSNSSANNNSTNSNKASSGEADSSFIRKNIHDNMHEVQMAELAIEKDVNQGIRNIAIKIRDDHKQMLNDLLTYAKDANLMSVMGTEMNISQDTVGYANAASGGKGVLTKNKREEVQSVDESRNKPRKKKAAQQADAGKPKDDKRGTGYDNSRSKSATGDTSMTAGAGITAGAADSAQAMHREHTASIQDLSGKEFEQKWVEEMITAHQAKLKELEGPGQSVTNSTLKQQVTAAIPIIRNHLQMLQQVR